MKVRARVAAALVLALAFSGLPPVPDLNVAPVEASSGSIDLLFFDGGPNDGITDGKPRTIAGPDEGLLEGNISPYVTTVGSGVWFVVDPIDQPEDGSHWQIEFGAPPGDLLAPGTYVAANDPYLGSGQAYFKLSGNSRGCTSTAASFRILEASFDASGAPLSFAADFSQTCGDTLRGEIRFHSSIDVRARDVAPYASAVTSDTLVGGSSTPVPIVVTNTGTVDLHPGEPVLSGPLAVTTDTCSGLAIAPGSTCVVAVEVVPLAGGPQVGIVSLRDDTVAARHDVVIRAAALWPTVTTLVSTVNPNHMFTELTTLIATVTPTPDRGIVEFYLDGSHVSSDTLTNGVAELVRYTPPPGAHALTATFTGRPAFAPSTSAVVTQHTTQSVTVDLWATPVSGPLGHPVAVGFDLDSPAQVSGGTVTLTDRLTGEVLATIAQPGSDYFACLSADVAGTHRLEATYSGTPADLPSSSSVDVAIGASDIVAGIPSDSAVPSGPAWCSGVRATDPVAAQTEPEATLNAYAIGPDPFTAVRLSNSDTVDADGLLAMSAEFPYGAPIDWSFVDPVTGGTPDNRYRVISWQVKDITGRWSAVFRQALTIDAVPPTATAPSRAFVTGSTLRGGKVPVRLSWSGTDTASGIARYELGQSTDDGLWTTVSTTIAAPSRARLLSAGHTYRFRVRAIDAAGNSSGWAYGASFRLSGYQEANTRLRYTGSWGTSTSLTWWGGKARASSAAGASVTFTFTGRSVAWIGLKAKTRGKAKVYVNGVLKATVDLYAATTEAQRLVWAANWSTSATRTITIKVVGTSGRPRIDMDAFVVGT